MYLSDMSHTVTSELLLLFFFVFVFFHSVDGIYIETCYSLVQKII